MDALHEITLDLAARVNPERSRKFSSKSWEESLSVLMELSSQEWLQSRAKRITLVGSNGKGSTAFFLAFLLQKELERTGVTDPVGLYTSPHLSHFLERIRLNLDPVSPETALSGLHEIREKTRDIYDNFTYFELMTLLAIRLFRNSGCEYEIYEAGLGGRLDATRMARSEVVVLTTISMEHTEILGDTKEKILREKLAMVQPSARLLIALHNEGIDDESVRDIARSSHPGLAVEIFRDNHNGGELHRSGYLEHNRRFAEFILERSGFVSSPSASPFSPPGRMEEREIFADPAGKGSDRTAPRFPCIYDTAHNEEAFRRALSDLKERENFPGEGETLICFAVLRDRRAGDAIQWIRASGYNRLLRIQGEDFADDPAAVPSISGQDPERFRRFLASEHRDCPVRLVVIIGSHRLYGFFRDLTDGSF